MNGEVNDEKSKQGLVRVEFSLLLLELCDKVPAIQHLLPLAAPVITGLEGAPHAQSGLTPPANQPPVLVSKPSLYGNDWTGELH
jgi:hypothetical protein